MRLDRYTHALLTLIGVALAAIAVNLWIGPAGLRVAGPRVAEAQAGKQITLPKDWGKPVGFIAGHVYLEAADGTIRLVNIGGAGAPIGSVGLVIARN